MLVSRRHLHLCGAYFMCLYRMSLLVVGESEVELVFLVLESISSFDLFAEAGSCWTLVQRFSPILGLEHLLERMNNWTIN